MIVVGLVLMVLGFLLGVPILWVAGIVIAAVGAVLWLADGAGATWGRRWY
jgi:hypothetical protein